MKRKSIRFRYFLSNLALLFLPLTAFSLFIFSFFSGQLENELIRNEQNTLSRIQTVLDMQVAQLYQTATQMTRQEDLRPFRFFENPLKSNVAGELLQNYTLTNSFISDIIIAYRGEHFFYTQKGSYTSDTFNAVYTIEGLNMAGYTDKDAPKGKPEVRRVSKVMINGNNAGDYLLFAFPLQFSYGVGQYGTAIFMVNSTQINRLIASKTGNDSTSSYIVTDGGDILFASPGRNPAADDEISGLIKGGAVDMEAVILKGDHGQRYLATFTASESFPWKYASVFPMATINRSLDHARAISGLFILATLIAGTLVLILLTHYNYNPVKRLKSEIGSAIPLSKESLNELDQIRESFACLLNEKNRLENRTLLNQDALKEHLAYRILSGEAIVWSQESSLVESLGYNPSEMAIRVVLINDLDSTGLEREYRTRRLNAFSNNPENPFQIMSMSGMKQGQLILLLLSSNPDLISDNKLVQDYVMKLADLFQPHGAVGIGTAGEAGKSLIEAQIALEYSVGTGSDEILIHGRLFEEPSSWQEQWGEMAMGLRQAIRAGELESTLNHIGLIHQRLKEAKTYYSMLRLFWYEALSQAAQDVRKHCRVSAALHGDDLYNLLHSGDPEVLINAVNSLARKLCGFVQTSRERLPGMQEIYVQYLSENALKSHFSVDEMADHFQISQTSLNKRFKQEVGSTIWDTAMKIRMAHAKNLLTGTQLSIQEIVELVGYQDQSNFTRKFKTLTGVTPLEYRLLNSR